MRRTLQFVLIAVALCAIVISASADVWSPTSGITLTEKEGNATLGSRIEAFTNNGLIGSWMSSTGQLPQLVCGLRYEAYSDFSGLKSVQSVELSPDHGKTLWKATLVTGKGYRVDLPDLEPGSYSLEWGVRSRDQRNRLMFIIIPINWSSSRSTSVANQLMVQRAPADCANFNDAVWFSCLRGFVSAQAEPDPGVLSRSQAVWQFMHPPAAASPPPVVPDHAPATSTEPDRKRKCESRNARDSEELRDVLPERPAERTKLNFPGRTTIFVGHMSHKRIVDGRYVYDRNPHFWCDRKLNFNKIRWTVEIGSNLVFTQGDITVVAKVRGINPEKGEITAIAANACDLIVDCNAKIGREEKR